MNPYVRVVGEALAWLVVMYVLADALMRYGQ